MANTAKPKIVKVSGTNYPVFEVKDIDSDTNIEIQIGKAGWITVIQTWLGRRQEVTLHAGICAKIMQVDNESKVVNNYEIQSKNGINNREITRL